MQRLVDAGVVTLVTVGRRNRAFEAGDVVRAFMDLERQLASPVGDTVVSPPTRRVPAKSEDLRVLLEVAHPMHGEQLDEATASR
jgi:hypothetical protein